MERLAISLGQEEGSADVSSSNEDSLAALESVSTSSDWHHLGVAVTRLKCTYYMIQVTF
jgi:hypothetical protein